MSPVKSAEGVKMEMGGENAWSAASHIEEKRKEKKGEKKEKGYERSAQLLRKLSLLLRGRLSLTLYKYLSKAK